MARCLSVRNCVNPNVLTITPSLADLVAEVPGIFSGNLQHLDDEWRHLPSISIPDNIKEASNPEEYFRWLSQQRNDEGENIFTLLPQFVPQFLSLPTSNADAERIFSKVNLNKTHLRNKLLPSTQAALVSTSETVTAVGVCVSFEPPHHMILCVKHHRSKCF